MNFVLDDIIDKFWKSGRIKDLEELSNQFDFNFSIRERLEDQPYEIKDFKVFRGRRAKRFRGILSKDEGLVEVRIYDYIYYRESRKRITTVFELCDNQFDLFPFMVKPKRSIQWVKEVFLRDHSFFPDIPGFHAYYEIDQFSMRKKHHQFTRAFVDLIASGSKISVEGQGQYLLDYQSGRITSAGSIMSMLDYALQLLYALREEEAEDDLV